MPKTKLDPTSLYRCVVTFTWTDDDGVPVVHREGETLLGSEKAVERHPDMFAPAGDLAEVSRKTRAHMAAADNTAVVRRKARREVRISIDGVERKIRAGELVDPSDPVLALVPDAFASAES